MFIAWYWLVIIGVVILGYVCHIKRYCAAYRQDRDALLEGLQKLRQRGKVKEGNAADNDPAA
jgi:hypothetical protein